jgi:hypothetical protein
LVGEKEEGDRVEPFPPTTYLKARIFGSISGPTGNQTGNFWSKPGSRPD